MVTQEDEYGNQGVTSLNITKDATFPILKVSSLVINIANQNSYQGLTGI